jgi:hypothetical protein
MKKILLIPVLFASKISLAQSKISGTITYFHNDYQGNKADVGSIIYVSDSSNNKIDFNAIDSLIKGEYLYNVYNESKDIEDKRSSKKRNADLENKTPEFILTNAKNYGVNTQKGYHNLDTRATIPANTFMKSPEYTTKADGAGNYNINIKRPGAYYVLVKSAHREGVGKTTMEGRLYLEKVKISDADEKNVSTNFKVY